MKKKYLSLLFGILVLGLSACSNVGSNKIKNTSIGDVLKINEKATDNDEKSLKYEKVTAPSGYMINSFLDGDLVVVSDSNNYKKIYSLYNKAFLLNKEFKSGWTNFTNYYTNDFTTIYEIDETESTASGNTTVYTYVDMYGNVFSTAGGKYNVERFGLRGIRFLPTKDANPKIEATYELNDNGKATIKTIEAKKSPEQKVGDYYIDTVNSEKLVYNNKTYYIRTLESKILVFDENMNYVSTKELDYGSGSDVIITFHNGNVLYQKAIELPSDSQNYSYYYSNKKYSLATYTFNLFDNSARTKIDFNYVLGGETRYYLEGVYEYSLVSCGEITEDKVVSLRYTRHLLDSNLNFTDSLDSYRIDDIKKTKNGYYDSTNGMLYDRNYKPLRTFKGGYIDTLNMFTVSDSNDKYGLIDEQGKVVVLNKYTSIDQYSYKNKVFASDFNELYMLDVTTGSKSLVTTSATKVLDGIYTSIDVANEKVIVHTLLGNCTLDGAYIYDSRMVNTFKELYIFKSPVQNNYYVISLNDAYFANKLAL